MYTIPPAGVHPTMPPPPAHRAKRALGFAVAGVALLLGAVAASRSVRPDAARVFAGSNDFELAAALAKLLFGASGTAQFVGVLYAFLSFRRARNTSSLALTVATGWVAIVAFWLYKSG